MSRRKQEKPQPRKRLGLVNSDVDLIQDILTCGGCQKEFVLSDIVKFIQHKVHLCNKENYGNFTNCDDGNCDSDHSSSGGAENKIQVSNRRPSISAPISRKSGSLLAARLESRDHVLQAQISPASSLVPPAISPSSTNDFLHRRNHLVHHHHHHEGKSLGDLLMASSERDQIHHHQHTQLRRHSPGPHNLFHHVQNRSRSPGRPKMVDAYTNTTITEPTSYICSTCKQSFTSAWVLVQHVQNMHGIKIFLEPGSSGGSASNRSTPASVHLSMASQDAPSSSSLAQHLAGSTLDPSSQHSALHLLRVPLGERQFGPSLNASALFSRPSSHDFRVEMLNDQYPRLNNHGSGASSSGASANSTVSVAAAGGGGGGSTSATGPLSLIPFDAHHPFDRGSFERPRVPPLGLSFEPQMDFYSQRLRQLAGATSPNAALTAATPSPRKLTPPYGSGSSGGHHPPATTTSSHSSSEPSTPTPSQQMKDHHHHHHHSSVHHSTPHHSSSSKDKPPLILLRSSSPSSNGSKGGDGNGNISDIQPGSPKLKACEFCGKSFRFQSNLIVHRRSHTGEKPFKCHICNHACTQASKLKRHMKTHRNKSPGGSIISENTSVESARSTPDSTVAADIGHNMASMENNKDGQNGRKDDVRSHRVDLDDGNNSDSQTADNEEEEDDDMDEEDDIDDDEDDDNTVDLIAEDLTTPKSGAGSSSPAGLSGNGRESKTDLADRHEARQSLLGEVMEKIGLSNIQQYNEAYKQALEESFAKNASTAVKIERPSSSDLLMSRSPHENGPLRDEGNKMIGQPPLDFGPSLLRAFDSPFESSKRLKMDFRNEGSRDRDSLYAGLWLPSVAASHRDLFLGLSSSDPELTRLKSSSECALKSVTPGGGGRMSPRPGTSGSGVSSLLSAAAAAASGSHHLPLALLGSSSGGGGNGHANKQPKSDRRNDTCEFCGKVFKNCSNLTVHRRSHTGEKPYKCELCSYACAQSSKLTRHMKTHGRIGKDVYRCRFCDMPFSVPSTLEKHMRKCVVNQNSSSSMLLEKDSDSKEVL